MSTTLRTSTFGSAYCVHKVLAANVGRGSKGHGSIARPDYCFEVNCCLRHPTEAFTYSANDIYFDLESLAAFCEELRGMQRGLRQEAALHDPGEMVVLRLKGNARGLQLTLNVREYLAPSIATLNASFDVDYDLFVNKLHAEMGRYLEELRQVEI